MLQKKDREIKKNKNDQNTKMCNFFIYLSIIISSKLLNIRLKKSVNLEVETIMEYKTPITFLNNRLLKLR